MDHSWDEVGHTDNMVLYAWYGHSGLPGMAGSGIRLESSPRHESRPGGRIMTFIWAAKQAKTSKSDRRSRNDTVGLEFETYGLEIYTKVSNSDRRSRN